MQVSELHLNLLTIFPLQREEIGIDAGLRPMERVTRSIPMTGDRLDFLDQQGVCGFENSVNTPVNQENEFWSAQFIFDPDLGAVTFRSKLLDALMPACPFQSADRK